MKQEIAISRVTKKRVAKLNGHSVAKINGVAAKSRTPLQVVSRELPVFSGVARNGSPWSVICGDARTALQNLREEEFACAVTSPPYFWQRDYAVEGQIGKESTIAEYVDAIVATMDGVRRVLRRDGVLFLNLGDTYYSAKGQPKGNDPKNRARRFGLRAVDASGLGVPRKTCIGIPWRVALRMIEHGWVLRSPIVWRREGALPEPTAKDRPWRTYEMVFMFSKSQQYWFDRAGLGAEQDVWEISSRRKNNNGHHSAAFPDELVERCLAIGCAPNGAVLDPFAGTGTVLRVAIQSGHAATGIDISKKYCYYMAEQIRKIALCD